MLSLHPIYLLSQTLCRASVVWVCVFPNRPACFERQGMGEPSEGTAAILTYQDPETQEDVWSTDGWVMSCR